jgi:hypothetical protein
MCSFATLLSSFFWAIFGIADSNTFNMDGYSAELIEVVAYILFACYEWIMIIILINILIAMMSESYDIISVSFITLLNMHFAYNYLCTWW